MYGNLIGRGANPPAQMKDDVSALIREQVGGKAPPKVKPMKKKAVMTTGTFAGKSNALGQGGRAAQLQAQGVPPGVIGELARKAGAAPGMPNYVGPKVKAKGGKK